MRRRSSTMLAVVAAGGVLALAGCGGGSGHDVPKNPKGELTASVGNLGQSDTLTTTLKLEITPSALQQLARADGDTLTAADAAAIAGAQLVVEAKTSNGKDLADVKPSDTNATDVAIRALSKGHSYLELRVISGDLYIQGDVKGILQLIHQQKAYAEVKARAATLPTFIKALVNGQWVSLNGAAAQGLAGQFGVQTGQSGNDSQSKKLLDDLKQVLDKDVSVTRVGSDDRGDHLRLSGNARQLADDSFQTLSKAVPGGGTLLTQTKPQDVPSRTIVVDAWVKDGVLSELSLDLGQFAKPGQPGAGKHLPITVTFEQSGDDISKPSDVTPVDLTQLGALLGALGGSPSG